MEHQLNGDMRVAGHLTIKTFRKGELIRSMRDIPNKVVTSSGYGRNLVARQLAGDTTYGIAIDSCSVGTDNTAAADAQTDLIVPTVTSIPITNATAVSNVLTVDVFVADGNLANNTYKEFGLFIGGRLFSRVVISPSYTKASGEDTLFTYTLTLTST